MNLKIYLENISKIPSDDACYISADYSLTIDIESEGQAQGSLREAINRGIGVRSNSFLLMIDTLTIIFTGPNYQLQSIDAYTNKSTWKRTELNIPTVRSSAILFITGEFTDDRASLEKVATYEFDARKSLLRISFGESKNEEYIQVSANVVIGISNEMISSVFVSDFVVR